MREVVFSFALLSSAKVFNVAAQISQQIEKDGNIKNHENVLLCMSSFLPFKFSGRYFSFKNSAFYFKIILQNTTR